jgi:hypothetical protein
VGADEDKPGLHIGREAVGEHDCLGDAARPRFGEDLERPAVRPARKQGCAGEPRRRCVRRPAGQSETD